MDYRIQITVVSALVLLAGGCASKSSARAQAQAAFAAGQQQPAATEHQPPAVLVQGDVKNHLVPWTEGLTLAEAIVAAEYRGLWDPHQIAIVRQGKSYPINVRRLLQGQNNPVLEPGDVVDIQR